MKRLVISGGLYGDALPSGEYAVGSHTQILTHAGVIPLPPGEDMALFLRCTNVPHFKCALKAHTRNATWEWDGAWALRPVGNGTQSHGYRPDGTLAILRPFGQQDSQGLRYWDPTAPAALANQDVTQETPGWVTGTPTYNPAMPLAIFYHVNRMYEWTHRDGIIVGQGADGGAVVQMEGALRQIEPGDTHNIQFHRTGDDISIAITRYAQHDVILRWMTVAEVKTLPLVVTPPPVIIPAPAPKPSPTPPPPTRATIASYDMTVRLPNRALAVARITEGEPDRFLWQYQDGGAWITAADNGADDLDHHYLFPRAGQFPIRLQTVVNGQITDTTGLSRIVKVTE